MKLTYCLYPTVYRMDNLEQVQIIKKIVNPLSM